MLVRPPLSSRRFDLFGIVALLERLLNDFEELLVHGDLIKEANE